MYYPETQLSVAASSREIRKAYLCAKTSSPDENAAKKMAELEKLIDPVKRTHYDHELGFDEYTISQAIQSEQNSWKGILKYGLACLALLLVLAGENVVRLYGFAFAPDFQERREIEFGEFEREDGRGRVVESSDHRYYSVFSSSSKTWQFVLGHPTFLLQLPTVAALILLSLKGSIWLDRFVSKRIARVRMNGEDDTSERKLWVALAALFVGSLWLLVFLFGYDRIVPVSR